MSKIRVRIRIDHLRSFVIDFWPGYAAVPILAFIGDALKLVYVLDFYAPEMKDVPWVEPVMGDLEVNSKVSFCFLVVWRPAALYCPYAWPANGVVERLVGDLETAYLIEGAILIMPAGTLALGVT